MADPNSNIQTSESINSDLADNQVSWIKTLQLAIIFAIKKWHPAWIISFFLLTIISVFIAYQNGLIGKLLPKTTPEVMSRCELIEYEMLRDRMSLMEVRTIFQDRGIKINSKSNTATYIWDKNGIKIIVEFVDGKLVSSNQESDCGE